MDSIRLVQACHKWRGRRENATLRKPVNPAAMPGATLARPSLVMSNRHHSAAIAAAHCRGAEARESLRCASSWWPCRRSRCGLIPLAGKKAGRVRNRAPAVRSSNAKKSVAIMRACVDYRESTGPPAGGSTTWKTDHEGAYARGNSKDARFQLRAHNTLPPEFSLHPLDRSVRGHCRNLDRWKSSGYKQSCPCMYLTAEQSSHTRSPRNSQSIVAPRGESCCAARHLFPRRSAQ